jgi:hypothetical protein
MLKIDESKVIKKFEPDYGNIRFFYRYVFPYIFWASFFLITLMLFFLLKEMRLISDLIYFLMGLFWLLALIYGQFYERPKSMQVCYFFEDKLLVTFDGVKVLSSIERKNIAKIFQIPYVKQLQHVVIQEKNGKKSMVYFTDQDLLSDLIDFLEQWSGIPSEFISNHFQRQKSKPRGHLWMKVFEEKVKVVERTSSGKVFTQIIKLFPFVFTGIGAKYTSVHFPMAAFVGLIVLGQSYIWDPGHEFIQGMKKPLFAFFATLFAWAILISVKEQVLAVVSLELLIGIIAIILVLLKKFRGKYLLFVFLPLAVRAFWHIYQIQTYGVHSINLAPLFIYSAIIGYYLLQEPMIQIAKSFYEKGLKSSGTYK